MFNCDSFVFLKDDFIQTFTINTYHLVLCYFSNVSKGALPFVSPKNSCDMILLMP